MMKKLDTNTMIRLGVIIVAITVSHTRLEGRVELLTATNAIQHQQINDKLEALNKTKKAYAGMPDTLDGYTEYPY